MQRRERNKIWTTSHGVANNAHLPLFLGAQIHKVPYVFNKRTAAGRVVGWGNKQNTVKAQQFALVHNMPYSRLEDGFIGYLGHPSENAQRLSLIEDSSGIYYDATQSNDLELLCQSPSSWFTPELAQRAQSLRDKLTARGLSKYNHRRESLPHWLAEQANHSVILVVDQTAGDMSVEYGLGSTDAFTQMITDALAEHPEQLIVVKTHPDVIKGKKQGYLDIDACRHPNVRLLGLDCALKALFSKVDRVYTVTSQLGFEGLVYGLPVHCYGMPFYAGWGLTVDKQVCARRNMPLTLDQLISAALIKYPLYLHPETDELCEPEAVIDWLTLQVSGQDDGIEVCYAFAFSLWKRAFIKQFVGRMARKVIFINDRQKLVALALAQPHAAVLMWGADHSDWVVQLKKSCPVWFIEDGFIRSIGLGADLCRPSSLVIDKQSMYYVPDKPSDIVDILNQVDLTNPQYRRTQRLIDAIVEGALSKYNVGQKTLSDAACHEMQILSETAAKQQTIILVPGQFEQDQSIANSRGDIKTNLGLLQQVRRDHPDAFIVYKEHPDLYSGVRPGKLGESAALDVADMYITDVDIVYIIFLCDRVCTLTSLTGFEALLRGKKVTTYGSPFYAGWGLSHDRLCFPERRNQLTLEQLAFATLVTYPQYVDWTTGRLTSPERVIDLLIEERLRSQSTPGHDSLQSSWLARSMRKVRYFYEAARFR